MESASKDRTPWKRARRIGGRLIGVGLLAGLLWLAATRWNGVPADPLDIPLYQMPLRIALDPTLDRSKELIAALTDLPPESAWTLPSAPAGMRWVNTSGHLYELGLEVYMFTGEWTPETRPLLRAVIDFLQRPSIQDPLDRLAEIEPGVCRIPYDLRVNLHCAPVLLLVRARYQHAERKDIDAAIDDLLAVLRLCKTCTCRTNYPLSLYGHCEWLAEREMQYLAFEAQLTRQQAKRIIEILQTAMPDERELWQYLVDIEIERLRQELDASYTLNPDGNGWLVLSRLHTVFSGPGPMPEARLGAWNVLSPLFNDRRTVASKIEQVRRTLEGIDPLPFKDVWRKTEALEAYRPFNPLDGPFCLYETRPVWSPHQPLVERMARRRATIVAVALSAYRTEHGRYPSVLQELIGDYLDAIPLDPYDDQPIRYVNKSDEDDFLLYCVSLNQTDDGGRSQGRHVLNSPYPDYWNKDLPFTHRRDSSSSNEIQLEKIRP